MQKHFVLYLSSQDGATYRVAGLRERSGTQRGYISNSRFSSPQGLYFWKNITEDLRPVVVNQNCRNRTITAQNYAQCQNKTISNNLEWSGVNLRLDIGLLRILNFTSSSGSTTTTAQGLVDYLLVADTSNHCIVSIDLTNRQTKDVAGVCGTSGFKDGPQGINLLNTPTMVGRDSAGNLFIADTGNGFVRMQLANSTELVTLEAGACGQLELEARASMGLKIPWSFCFKGMVKNGLVSEPKEHYYNNAALVSFCEKHEVLCRKQAHPLVSAESGIVTKKGLQT